MIAFVSRVIIQPSYAIVDLYVTEIEGLGAYFFCHVCHSVIPNLFETFTLLITFNQWKLAKAFIFHMRILSGMTFSKYIFDYVTLTLEVGILPF